MSWLQTLAAEPRTCVFFESPRRLADCLRDAVDVLGPERRAVVCRELTKTHEEIVRGSLGRARRVGRRRRAGRDHRRAGRRDATADLPTLVADVTVLVDDGMRVKDACAQVIAANPGSPSRRELYDAVLRSRRLNPRRTASWRLRRWLLVCGREVFAGLPFSCLFGSLRRVVRRGRPTVAGARVLCHGDEPSTCRGPVAGQVQDRSSLRAGQAGEG